jgi:hypothetical protein
VLAVALSQISQPPADGQKRLPTWVLATILALILAAFVGLLIVIATTGRSG